MFLSKLRTEISVSRQYGRAGCALLFKRNGCESGVLYLTKHNQKLFNWHFSLTANVNIGIPYPLLKNFVMYTEEPDVTEKCWPPEQTNEKSVAEMAHLPWYPCSTRKTIHNFCMCYRLTSETYLVALKHQKSSKCQVKSFSFFKLMSSNSRGLSAKSQSLILTLISEMRFRKLEEGVCNECQARWSFDERALGKHNAS